MEKVRIGNDIQVKYTVLRDGQPESFVGATNIVVEVKNEAYAKIIPSTFSILNNIVTIDLDAKDCTLCGKHRVTLSYNRGNDITIDALAFELVQFTSQTGGTEIVGVEIVTVNISGDIGIAIPDNNKIDLNGLNSNIDKLHFKPDTLVALSEIGDVRYSQESKTLEVKVSDTVSIQLGQEMQTRVKNNAGVQINNGQMVYIDSASGANPLAKIASTTDANIAQRTFGMATENIASNGFGAITTEGLVRDVNTAAFTEGDMLWLGVNGTVTNIEPVAPTPKISVGMVLRSNVNSGVIYVKIRAIARNQKLSDVYAPTLTGGDILRWNSTTLRFETFNITTALAGKADLVDGKIPTAQLPSYVDDVLEYTNLAAFPSTGETGKIYVALDTNLTYRWSGTAYVEISKSLALGETSSTAYRGDRGKTAYDHSQTTGNAHGTTAAQIPNTPAGTVAATTVQAAINELAGDIVKVETDLNLLKKNIYFITNLQKWYYSTANPAAYLKISDYFSAIRIDLRTTMKRADGTYKKIFIRSFDSIGGVYNVHLNVETDVENVYISKTAVSTVENPLIATYTGDQFNVIEFELNEFAKPPYTINVAATYLQGGLSPEYIRIINSKLEDQGSGDVINKNVVLWSSNVIEKVDFRKAIISMSIVLKTEIDKNVFFNKIELYNNIVTLGIVVNSVTYNSTAVYVTNSILNFTFDNAIFTASVSVDTTHIGLKTASNLATASNSLVNPNLIEFALLKLKNDKYIGGLFDDTIHKYAVTTVSKKNANRTCVLNAPLRSDKQINYVNIYNPPNSVCKVCLLTKTGSNYTVRISQTINLVSGTEMYAVNLQGLRGDYFALYVENRGYSTRTANDLTIDNASVYIGDPTSVGSFTVVVANEYPYFSYMTNIYIGERLNSLEQKLPSAPLSNSAIRAFDTATGGAIFIPDPYGYNQFVHPNILYFDESWNGFKYWMVVTPFPIGSAIYGDRFENPCIYCSNDGIKWLPPVGLANPIDDITAEEIADGDYMSDPVLCYNSTTSLMECWYRITHVADNNHTYILRKTSADGVVWSAREVLIDCNVLHMVRSQKVLWDSTRQKYRMWYTGGSIGATVTYNESSNGTVWDLQQACTGLGNTWHLDLTIKDGVYYMLSYGEQESLSVAQSVDGLVFTNWKKVLSPVVSTWYNTGLYKSTLLFNGEKWLMYFSGDSSTKRFIGLAIGDTPYDLAVIDGGFKPKGQVVQGDIKLVNNSVSSSGIVLSDSGHFLGFDVATGSLYFQRPDGTRTAIAL